MVRLIGPDGDCVYKDRMSVTLPERVGVQSLLAALGFGQLSEAFKRQRVRGNLKIERLKLRLRNDSMSN